MSTIIWLAIGLVTALVVFAIDARIMRRRHENLVAAAGFRKVYVPSTLTNADRARHFNEKD